MRHSEIAQSPRKSGYDFAPVGGKQAAAEGVARAVLQIGIHRGQRGRIQLSCQHVHDRDRQHRRQHQKPLEKVRPAYGAIAAEERIDDDDQRKDQHRGGIIQAGEDRGKHRRARHERRSYIHSKAYQKDHRADDLQRRILRFEPVGQILR